MNLMKRPTTAGTGSEVPLCQADTSWSGRSINSDLFLKIELHETRHASAGAFLHAAFFIRNRREIPVLHTKFFRFLIKYFRFLVKFGENNQFF